MYMLSFYVNSKVSLFGNMRSLGLGCSEPFRSLAVSIFVFGKTYLKFPDSWIRERSSDLPRLKPYRDGSHVNLGKRKSKFATGYFKAKKNTLLFSFLCSVIPNT